MFHASTGRLSILRVGVPTVCMLLLLLPNAGRAAEQTSRPFVGVTLERIMRAKPRPQVIHIAVIDPTAPGIRFLVTPSNGDPNGAQPGDPNLETTRETTLQFITRQHAQLGINASFFRFVKHTLDTNDVSLVVSDGHIVSPLDPVAPWILNIAANNQAQIRKVNPAAMGRSDANLYNAVAGRGMLVRDGKIVAPTGSKFDDSDPPRTAVGITATGHLLLVTVDGRQPGFAEGMSLPELAHFMLAHGAVTALNLDGGGSTTMAIADPHPRVINFPSDHKPDGKPGLQREVGVSVAVFARANPGYVPLPPVRKPRNEGVDASPPPVSQ